MTYTDHIVAHHPVALSELEAFRWADRPLDRYGIQGPRPGGWYTLDYWPNPWNDDDWLALAVAQTRAPVMVASFFDEQLGVVRGLTPDPRVKRWEVRLHPEWAPTRYPTPKHRDLHWGLPPTWMISDELLSGAAAVEAIAGWSAAAGGEADRAALAAFLAEEPLRFKEDAFSRLLDVVGLSEHVELAPHPHAITAWDDPAKTRKSLEFLKPGRWRAITCHEHRNCYAMVRMLAEDDYVIEYREEKPDILHQTFAASLDQAVAAMQAWATGDTLWRDGFAWTVTDPAPDPDPEDR